MKNINIYLIRHGESEGNIIADKIGQDNNTALTKNGIEQATKLAHRRFHFDKPDFIASSTFKRALQTARIVSAQWNTQYEKDNDDDGILTCPELVEYNPGDWKGKNRSEIYADTKNAIDMSLLHMGFQFPNGETYHQTERRAAVWLEEHIIYNKDILNKAQDKDVNAIVFSHGMTIKTLLHYIMGFDQSFLWKIHLDNTSICHIVYNDKGFFLKSINDTGHLI